MFEDVEVLKAHLSKLRRLGLAWPLLEQDHEFYNPNSTKKSNNQENLRVSSFLSQNQEILPQVFIPWEPNLILSFRCSPCKFLPEFLIQTSKFCYPLIYQWVTRVLVAADGYVYGKAKSLGHYRGRWVGRLWGYR